MSSEDSHEDRPESVREGRRGRQVAQIPGEGVQPELNKIATCGGEGHKDFDRSNSGLLSTKRCEIHSVLARRWQRPYSKALIEANPRRMAGLIADAENAIFTRYLELCAEVGTIEENLALQNAVHFLKQLKNDAEIACLLPARPTESFRVML